ncbi:MAG TPA: nicotinate-nucleotide adenylyltransferase [Armatimonadota bacterium]|nr:nicotinate-nucleotide adenylyltransferase [Armatimonadota bacterium]
MKEAVGIMGGTFDPIHFGHLVAAEEARVRFRLARVIFVPNGRPPHKKEYKVTPAEARYEMVVLATASNPAFEVSRVEVDRPGPSYAVDTVGEIEKQLGGDTPLYFITGADAMLEFMTWHEPGRLAGRCQFIAVMRPGYEMERLERALGQDLMARTRMLRVPGVDISSTELRRRAGSGESLRYLTPGPVVRYIEAHHLYGKMGVGSSSATPGDSLGGDR